MSHLWELLREYKALFSPSAALVLFVVLGIVMISRRSYAPALAFLGYCLFSALDGYALGFRAGTLGLLSLFAVGLLGQLFCAVVLINLSKTPSRMARWLSNKRTSDSRR